MILKHELTRPVKEDDRTRHIVEQKAHAEPVMLTFRDDDAVEAHMRAAMTGDPLYDFTAEDGVQHTIWRVSDPSGLVKAFGNVSNLYVADGHHRCKAASRAAEHFRDGDSAQTGEGARGIRVFPRGAISDGDDEDHGV